MSERTYTFYSDPGHAWLEVPRQDVRTLGVEVSHYSYMRGPLAYLEEDCDASAFLTAAKSAGWTVTIREQYVDPQPGEWNIRNFPSYA